MIFLFLIVCLFFARVFPGGDAPVHRVAKYADANQVSTSKFVRSRRIEAARPRAYGRGFQLKWTPPTDWSLPLQTVFLRNFTYTHTHTHFTLYFSRISATKEITSILGSMAVLKLYAIMRRVSWIFPRWKIAKSKNKREANGPRGKTKVKTRTQFEER